ncbi:MAG: SdpI family protein [Halococcoides sp.]
MDVPELDRRTTVGLAIVAVSAVASVVSAPQLPARIVTHWSGAGAADGWMPAPVLLVGGPALVFATVIAFEAFPRIDPLGANISEFQAAYDAAAIVTAGFLAYVYGLALAWNLGVEMVMGQALAPAIGALVVVLGFVLDRAEQNWFIGIRTPWTLSSETVWHKTHDLGGTLFKISGVIAAGGVVVPQYAEALVVGPLVAASLIAGVYSFVTYRQLDASEQADSDPT